MKTKQLSVLLPVTLAGLSPMAAWGATVDTDPTNDLFSGADTWTWQTDNMNDGMVDDDIDFFSLSGFTPGSQVRVTFTETGALNDGPIRLEAFNTTQVQGDNVTLSSVLGTLTLSGFLASSNMTVTIPANGLLGLKITDMDSLNADSEGYRITIEVLSTSVPLAAWPVVPLLGAAAVAELRRRQKRKDMKQAA